MNKAESGCRTGAPGSIRILFMALADADNTNAQSLNARDIALRLDPERFHITFFYQRVPDPRLENRLNIRLLKLPAHNRTWRVLREMLSGPQLIAYVDHSPAAYLFLHLPAVLRKKTITVLHVEGPLAQVEHEGRWLRFLYHSIVARCSVCTGITPFILREMESHGHGSEYVLPVGVDTTFFVPPPSRKNPRVVVLFVGTIIERKGADLLLAAARQIPEAQFRLVGSSRGGFAERLQQQAQQLKLSNIEFSGPQSQPSLLQIMQHSDVFLLPSRLEGMPKVTLEAAATGLPCIVFQDYETSSVIDGKTGFQVASFEEMIERLRLLIGNTGLRMEMSEAAIRHARSFDWDVVARQWEDAYLKIAAELNGTPGLPGAKHDHD